MYELIKNDTIAMQKQKPIPSNDAILFARKSSKQNFGNITSGNYRVHRDQVVLPFDGFRVHELGWGFKIKTMRKIKHLSKKAINTIHSLVTGSRQVRVLLTHLTT